MKSVDMKYSFSFTATTMRLPDFIRLSEAVELSENKLTYENVDHDAVLSKGNKRTSKREMQELIKRYNSLTKSEKSLLYNHTHDSKKKIAYLGICKTYEFIRDFVIEVVREKTLVFDFQLEAAELTSFINRKRDMHPELDEFAESTIKKAKQHTFKILEESGVINSVKEKIIQPQFLDTQTMSAVIEDNPEFLKLFLMSDRDIQLALSA